MKVLVLGSGGREHALAWKLNQDQKVTEIYLAPGNAGTGQDFHNVDLSVMDFEGIADFCLQEGIDWVVVGPEDPLAGGITDFLEERGLKVFGPNQACARFEKSKDFTKKFLMKYDIPTAHYFSTRELDAALAYAEEAAYPLVIKADGLCAGKGVVIVENVNQAAETLKQMMVEKRFGDQADLVVMEEFLTGIEQSLLCFVSQNKCIPMESAQDYKRLEDGDQGPNTGGMGALSPSPLLGDQLQANIQDILRKIESGLEAEGLIYNGVLFIGFMIENHQAKVLEFNVRFGDPETEVLMPRLESDLLEIIDKTNNGQLQAEDLKWSDQASVGVVLCSEGYPDAYTIGIDLDLDQVDLDEQTIVFHNGSRCNQQGKIISHGGRVLTAVSLAENHSSARKKAYQAVEKLQVDGLIYRQDIGL